jgi:gamma-glutamylcyclotransferase
MAKKLTHYFAYGSNMHIVRLRRRLKTIIPVEGVCLKQFALTFGKRGRDGSAKCTIESADDDRVYGVLFRLPAELLALLDAIEGSDYERITVHPVGLDSGSTYRAHCYCARPKAIVEGLLPFDWYRSFVVEGARLHGLPDTYVSKLANMPVRTDPNSFRRRQQYRQPDRHQDRQQEGYWGKNAGYGRGSVAGPKTGWLIDGCYRDRYHDVTPRFAL